MQEPSSRIIKRVAVAGLLTAAMTIGSCFSPTRCIEAYRTFQNVASTAEPTPPPETKPEPIPEPPLSSPRDQDSASQPQKPAREPARPMENEPEPPKREVRLHQGFPVARLYISGKTVSTDAWEQSTEVIKKEKVTVAVLATWCPACKRFLAQLNSTPADSRPVDLVVFYEDEVDRILTREEDSGNITADQRQEMKEEYDNRSQLLIDPEALANFSLDFYFVRADQFQDLVNAYPTILACDPDGCQRAN